MLKYNTMRFGTDTFVLSGASSVEPVPDGGDEDTTQEDTTPIHTDPVDDTDSTSPKVAVRLGGEVYYFQLSKVSA